MASPQQQPVPENPATLGVSGCTDHGRKVLMEDIVLSSGRVVKHDSQGKPTQDGYEYTVAESFEYSNKRRALEDAQVQKEQQ